MPIDWGQLEQLMWRDPAARGVSGYRFRDRPLAAGQLQAAAESLAQGSGTVAIATGFWIPPAATSDGESASGNATAGGSAAGGGSAETDGPPGALFLARALMSLGREVLLVTDAVGLPLLEAGCDALDLPRSCLREFPFEDPDPHHPARASNAAQFNTRSDQFVRELLASASGRRLSHLIAIERAGPSHTVESALQCASFYAGEDIPGGCFESEVPERDRNCCHNMRGESINPFTAKVHRLFEEVSAQRPNVTTIGIADGGNEIGMGCYPWKVMRSAIAFGPSGRVACRIATHHTLLAGVSNWGGYALALAVCETLGRGRLAQRWDLEDQRSLVETLVAQAGAVDGVTRTRQATVDGLPLETYLQPLHGFRQTLGLDP